MSGYYNQKRRRRRRHSPVVEDLPPVGERSHLVVATINAISRQPQRRRWDCSADALGFIAEHPALFGEVSADWDEDSSPRERDAALSREIARIEAVVAAPKSTALDRRIDWLGRLTGLTSLDRAIAALAVRRRLWPLWSTMCERVLHQSNSWLKPSAIAAMLGVATASVRSRLERHQPLMMGGLLEDHHDDDFSASDFLVRLGRLNTTDPARLAAAMIQVEAPSTLEWDDFAHFEADRDLAANLVAAAARRREGINILLHGLPGTGKTEFARAIADRLGLQAVFVGKADNEGGDPTRSERIGHLAVVRALTRRSRQHLIVVDEAEDVMIAPRGRDRSDNSKLWLNHLIERSSGPTIWIANDLDALGGPVIRRMSAAIGFPLPPETVRERVIERHANQAGISLGEAERRNLARLPVPPAVAAHAVRAASLTDRASATMERVAAGLGEALGGRRLPTAPPEPTPFEPSLSCADHDLARLASQLEATPDRAWSMLLEGVPGTGKSAYARHLAKMLGLELIERRGSDLLGAFVGETEEKIARAFTDAAKRGALLLLDEADALLRDRRGATRGWEVSMTNEMLAWMERHPAPFIVTTNLADTLDPATSRRFLFRIRFDALDAQRAGLLWESHFGDPAPCALAEIEGLTPSDFSNVARRARLTGGAGSERRLAMLRAEAEAKPSRSRPIGFELSTVAKQMLVPGAA